jgi:hypothetical protein
MRTVNRPGFIETLSCPMFGGRGGVAKNVDVRVEAEVDFACIYGSTPVSRTPIVRGPGVPSEGVRYARPTSTRVPSARG